MIGDLALRARTVWLDHDADLVAAAGPGGWLFERDGAGIAGRGVALRIPVPSGMAGAGEAVAAALDRVEHDDEVGAPGAGPVALGALPFDSSAPAELVVPARVVGRLPDGRSWQTTLRDDDTPSPSAAAADPDGFTLQSPVPHEEWMAIVGRAVEAIGSERFSKVVLAREVLVTANRDIAVPTVLRRLRSLYPACAVVAVPTPEGQFVAASPELLVSRAGRVVRSHPLAGTIPRSGDPVADRALAEELIASTKERAEHAWVVRDVVEALTPWCTSLTTPESPSIVALRNVSHLGTEVEGRLTTDAPSALGLAALLHPTAAVGGTPREAALAWLAANERLDRGAYAGPVGWVDARGDGEWVVGIRCGVLSGRRARLFAGVGVVEGSDPAAELSETQFKLQAMLAAVVRP